MIITGYEKLDMDVFLPSSSYHDIVFSVDFEQDKMFDKLFSQVIKQALKPKTGRVFETICRSI